MIALNRAAPCARAAPRALPSRRHRAARAARLAAAAAADASSSSSSSSTETSSETPVLSPEDLVRAQYAATDETQAFGDSILGGASVVRGSAEETRDLVPFGANNLAVLRATKQYAEAIENDLDPSEVIAKALGVESLDDLSPAQRAYSDKVRAKLEENAQRMRGFTLEASRLHKKAEYAYSKGLYVDCVRWCDTALEETEEKTLLGGRILIQKCLGLDASGKTEDAIELYAWLAATHPEGIVKRQAEELKYILEAPKMDIGEDEKVDVPVLRDAYAYSDKWASTGGGKKSGGGGKREKSLEEEYGGEFTPSVRLPQNPFITVAASVIAAGIAYYSATIPR